MYNIAICDDELMFRSSLKNDLLKIMSPDKIKIYEYVDGEDIMEDISDNMYWDVIFMDIKMNEISGQEVIKKIRETKAGKKSIVVFLTSYNSNITEIVSLRPFAYIYKDKISKELENIISDILIELEINEERIEFHENRKEYRIKQRKIKYAESFRNVITIVTEDGKFDTRDYSITKLKEVLTNPYFFQCCSSAIINYKYIRCIMHDRIIMDDGKEFKIGRKYRDIVKSKI